jgi:hypothetical protein
MYQFPYIPSGYEQQGQFSSQFQQSVQSQPGQGVYVPPHQPSVPQLSLVQQPQSMAPHMGAIVQAAEVVKPAGKSKKSVRCWKCADNSHAVKDCKVDHYCYICDKKAHPTARCPVLKLPRPSVFVSGSGLLETYFTAFPDSVVNDDLAPTQSPIALVVVTGDVVPADVIAKQVARRCSDHPNWKWEAVPHSDLQFLVSVPSFDDLDRLDGIQVGVPSFSSSISISAWRSAEVPHKAELEKVWLHVDGVPHTLRHFLGLWAVGSLVGKTVDVDLVSLRRRAVVRIQVAMLQAGVLGDPSDEARPIAKADVVVKFKAFEFRFRREPADYIPEPDFVPFVWVKKDDPGEGGGGAPDGLG